jgi:hypothetical protein
MLGFEVIIFFIPSLYPACRWQDKNRKGAGNMV